MRLAFSTNAFTSYPVEEAVVRIAEIGYQGVEILADRPHLYPPEITDGVTNRIKKILGQYGIEVSNINANTASGYFDKALMETIFEPSLSNKDNELREWRVRFTKESINIAEELGAKNISITSGRPIPGCPPERGIENFKRSLEDILICGERRGVSIGIEYEPGLLIENAEETLNLMQMMDSRYLGVNLDIGHLVVSGEDPAEVIQSLSPYLLNIHIEDIRGRKHYHLIPGKGDIDMAAVSRALRNIQYKGFVTVELYTYNDSPERAAYQALQYLKGL